MNSEAPPILETEDESRYMIWFTSDTHFGHDAVIQFCKRPFKDVSEMNEELVRRWNTCVKPGDLVYHLGDVSFANSTATQAILARLNGYKILVVGNHDSRTWKMIHRGFDVAVMNAVIRLRSRRVFLSHFPYRSQYPEDTRDWSKWPLFNDNGKDFLLHGHVHCIWKRKGRMINVGVDVWDYAPVCEEEITDIIENYVEEK